MNPELIGTFFTEGDDGNLYTVYVRMTFSLAGRTIYDKGDRWKPDARPEMVTADWEEVYSRGDDAGRYGIVGSGVILTPEDDSPAKIDGMFRSRYQAMNRALGWAHEGKA